jgi:hypothetical protein
MEDGQRTYPVDYLIIHHSMGDPFMDAEEMKIQDAYDYAGWKRGYQPINCEHSLHRHPQCDRQSFAMAHYALHFYHGKWRLVPLIDDPWGNVTWHAGNLEINKRSIGIEVCGDYRKQLLPIEGLQMIADFIRPHYLALKAVRVPLKVCGHKNVSLGVTECPGMIHTQLQILKDMIFKN